MDIYGAFMLSISSMVRDIINLLFMIPLFILSFFDIYYFTIVDRDKQKEIMKKLMHQPSTKKMFSSGQIQPDDFFWGKWFVGYVGKHIIIISSKHFFTKLINSGAVMNDTTETTKSNKKMTTILRRVGTFSDFYYNDKKIDNSHFCAFPSQEPIMGSIKEEYKKRKGKCFSAFISGGVGVGKTTIGILLAIELNGVLCTSFNPSDPGDSLENLTLYVDNENEGPLIIVFDEVDIMIRDIHNGIKPHKDIPIEIKDKTSYNRFFDELMYQKNIILLLISNKPKEIIDAFDPCYLREGRIHNYYSM